ncbi:hypothetical protein Q1695_006806 [Nippostrongylus brasiliensis]|nr:hypothetical protein Q1695_006806 [Nippostrongylus brasiliensis]
MLLAPRVYKAGIVGKECLQECEQLMEEEIAEFDTLKIELFGTTIRYEGGVLIGWRLTSLIGTMASELRRWCSRTNNIQWMVQGDDVLIMGDDIDAERLQTAIDGMN